MRGRLDNGREPLLQVAENHSDLRSLVFEVKSLFFRVESATVDYSGASEACASLAENGK